MDDTVALLSKYPSLKLLDSVYKTLLAAADRDLTVMAPPLLGTAARKLRELCDPIPDGFTELSLLKATGASSSELALGTLSLGVLPREGCACETGREPSFCWGNTA